MSDEPQRPPIADSPISVVLLAQNVEASVEEMLRRWVEVLTSLDREHEVIVVDNASTDRTAEKVSGLAGQQSRIRFLRQEKHQAVGAAIRIGLAAAQYPLFFYSACDRGYQPADLRAILQDLEQVDLVSGYRIGRPVPWWLCWLGRVYRLFIRVLFGVPLEPLPGWLGWRAHFYHWLIRAFFGVRIVDIGSEFKLFRRSILARIPIQSDGPFVHAEILAKANFLGCLMTESAISSTPPPTGEKAVSFRAQWPEACRVFSRPDFGPAVVTGQTQPKNV